MVVVAALGTALRIAPGPHARVHGKDERFIRVAQGERTTGEEPSQGFVVDPSAIQGGVEAPTAPEPRRGRASPSHDDATPVGSGEREKGRPRPRRGWRR